MLAWSFLLPITQGKPKCRHAEELLWQTCHMLLPFSCPILPFKAGKLKGHRSSNAQITKICFTPKVKDNKSHAWKSCSPNKMRPCTDNSIYWTINPGHALLFLKLWTFKNSNTQTNPWSGNVTAEYCSPCYFAWVLCIRKGIQT